MFWKKKKDSNEIFSYESEEKRKSFRVVPPSDRPLRATFKGCEVVIGNIGAIGVAFSQGDFAIGDKDVLAFALPDETEPIRVQSTIVAIDNGRICHCRFDDLDAAAFDAIHRYMLAVQLKDSREKHKESQTSPPEPQGCAP